MAPWELHFIANDEFKNMQDMDDRLRWYLPLKEIPEGSDLLQVWAWNKPAECGGVFE